MNKKDKEKFTEMGYTIEALKDEVDFLVSQEKELNRILDKKQARIEQLIDENDQLNMASVPVPQTVKDIFDKASSYKTHKVGALSLDFWPPSDWFRISLHRWSPGKAFQLCLGPLRFDWFDG